MFGVNKKLRLYFLKADNPYDMIKHGGDKEIIRPCGLSPMKSKGIHGLSHILIDKHGVCPSFEYLEELLAVGHKTTSVVTTYI
jgi:endonuclease-3